MNIGMILEAAFPPDIRVEKEARSLTKAGFNVFVLSCSKKHSPLFEEIDGVKVLRTGPRAGGLLQKCSNLLNALLFNHPLWIKPIKNFINEYKIDILHVHDLPLVNTALKVGRKLKIPVVADLHENYPAGLQVWGKWNKNPVKKMARRILFNYSRWIAYEKRVCSEVDKIIVVVDEMKDRLMKTHNISADKITVVTNTEGINFIENAKSYHEISETYKDRFIISYIGAFGPHRGLDTVIRGMAYVKNELPNALLLLIGKGNKYIEDELIRLVNENNLEKNVKILGWQPFEKVYSYMCMSNVGVVPHNKNEHTDHTIPHKLFQYMMVSKPLVVSNCKPLKRIVETLNSGLVFEAGNPESFAESVMELYRNPDIADNLGENGRKATIEGKWNWEDTGNELTKLYSNMTKERDA